MIKRCGLVDRIFFNPVQRTQYYPSGLPWAEGLNPGLQQRKYNGKEFVEMSGYDTYDYGARGMYPALGIFTTVDPLAEKYYSVSPYAYCLDNPVKFIDPNGMDWVNSANGGYVWMDNVTSAKNTPEGYRYIGSSNTSILSDLKVNYSFSNQLSNRIGYVAADAEEGKYAASNMTNAIAESSIKISANVSFNTENGTDNNSAGRKFEGVNVSGTVVSSVAPVDGDASTSAKMSVGYGGKTYTSAFVEPSQAYVTATGTQVGVTSVSIPASSLSSTKSFTEIRVSGNWWVTNSAGNKTPVVYNSMVAPVPQSFNHVWIFPKK